MKRILCIIISICLLMPSIGVFSAFAADSDELSALQEFNNSYNDMVSSSGFTISGSIDKFYNNGSSSEEDENDSTNRLIVKSKNEIDSLDSVNHICGYNDLHILQFDDGESFSEAYKYYSELDYVDYVQEDKFCEEYSIVSESVVQKPMAVQSAKFGYTSAMSSLGSASSLPTITVAVVDSGIENDHDLLSGRIQTTGFNSVGGDSCYDDRGHGTQVAGIIASNTLTNVKIRPYKVLDDSGRGTDTQVYLGIQAAIEDGVDIINLSLSRQGESEILHEGVRNAYNAGIVVVAAAGNDGYDISNNTYSPASFEEAITVMACDDTRRICSFSNHGTSCDVAAPGENILSSYLGNTYKSSSGTSMAAPFIVAAVTYQLSKNSSLSPDSVKAKLIQSSQPCYGGVSGKCVYPGTPVTYAEQTVKPVFNKSSTSFMGSVSLEISCSVASAKILYRTDKMAKNTYLEYKAPLTFTESVTVSAYCVETGKLIGSPASVTLTIINVDASYFTIDETGTILSYNGEDAVVTVPATYNDINITAVADDAFRNNAIVTSVNLNSSVTKIGNNTFNGCVNLESITASGVKEIGDSAFSGCSSLKTVSANAVTQIGTESFNGCSSLTSISFPKLIEVPDYSFENASSLKTATISSATIIGTRAFAGSGLVSVISGKATTIGEGAFADCANLFSATITNAEVIGDSAFENCSSLKTVASEKLTDLGDRAYSGATALHSATFNSLNTVGAEAFYGTAITSVSFGNLTELGADAFVNCTALEEVCLDSLTSVNLSDFEGCSNIKKFSFNSAEQIDTSNLLLGELTPYVTDFCANNITLIPNNFFRSCKNLSNVELSSVTSVGEYAFYDTAIPSADFSVLETAGIYAFSKIPTLETVNLPKLKSFDSTTFSGSSKIKTIVFESLESRYDGLPGLQYSLESYTDMTLTDIKSGQFSGCANLKSVSLPAAVTVGKNAFNGTALTRIELPMLETAADNAFSGCSSLTTVVLKNLKVLNVEAFSGIESNITYINVDGATAFDSTDNMKKFTSLKTFYGNSLKSIPSECFMNLPKLYYVYIDSAENLGASAFYNCSDLYTCSVSNVRRIESNVFYGCTNFISITADKATDINFSAFENSAVQSISFDALTEFPTTENGSIAFPNSEKLRTVSLNSLKEVPANFLAGCPLLTIVHFDKATVVGDRAFYNTSLNTYYLSSVVEIGNEAFFGTRITKVNFPNVTAVGDGAFAECAVNSEVSLPLVEALPASAFKNNVYLTKIDMPVLTSVGDYCFYNCDKISYPTLESITDIGDYAFADCDNLRSVTITKINSLGEYAFANCGNLATVVLPVRFTEIPKGCFKNCSYLSASNSRCDYKHVKKINEEAFAGCKRITADAFEFDILEYIGKNALNASGLSETGKFEMKGLKTAEVGAFNGLSFDFLYLENVVELYSLPVADCVLIGSGIKSFSADQKNSVVIGHSGSVVENYCDSNDISFVALGEKESVITDVAGYYNSADALMFESFGFNLTYKWYGCNNENRTDAVVLEGLDENVEDPIEFLYDEGRAADYKYYYCEATSTDNGNEVKIRSSLCHNLFNVIRTVDEDVTNVDYMECYIYTYSPNNVGTIENALIVDGDIELTPYSTTAGPECYGTGTTLDIYHDGVVADSYTLVVYSDVNADGVVDVLDVRAIERVSSGKRQFLDLFKTAADTNQNGSIDSLDYQQAVNQALSW